MEHSKTPWKIGAMESGQAAIDSADGNEVTGFIDMEDARRILACVNACAGILTEKLEGKSIEEYVTEQAFLTGMAPSGEGFGVSLNGMACQMLAASFAGQFVGSGAVNFLEVNMEHQEIGPFAVTIQRHQGKTPGQMKAEVEQQLATERSSLFAESQRKQQLEQQVGELVGVLEAMLEEVAGCYCTTEAAARAVIQKVRGGE